MNRKTKVGIPLAVLTIIAGIAGGSYAFDFSTTTTTTISDDDITITNLDISIDALKQICRDVEIPEQYQGACDILELLP